jgi:dolichol-phosphate mannosyltransferase
MISVVIPVFNEAEHIETSIKTIINVFAENGLPYQLILVDDGSSDKTWGILKKVEAEDRNVLIIRLSRNFGKESAICAGLDYAAGDATIIMDSDLQHPPTIISDMVNLWLNQGYEVVEAVKASRGKEPLKNKLGAYVFYGLLEKCTGYNLKNASDYKLLDAKVITSWKNLNEKNTFFRGMTCWLGFNRATIYFDVPPRKSGKTKWSTAKLIKLAINAIASFSSAPLKIISALGTVFLIMAIVFAIQTFVMKISGKAATGFTTVILLLLLIGSLNLISLGIIGTYISKIFDEVKARPRYIIKEKTGKGCIGEK